MSARRPPLTKPAQVTETLNLETTEQALQSLLGDLLAEVPEADAQAPLATAAMHVSAAPAEVALGEPEPLAKPTAEPEPLPEPTTPLPLAPPDWAENDFKVLLVRIGGMRFGLPLVCLHSIARLQATQERITVPAQPAWHRGVIRYRAQSLILADIGVLLDLGGEPAQENFVLVLGEGRAGLICDALEDQISLRQEQVNWRLEDAARQWSFGMMPEQMCALLNPEGIIQRLQGQSDTQADQRS